MKLWQNRLKWSIKAMTTDIQGRSGFYNSFESELNALKTYQNDPLINRLLFSHTISIMEKYLSDLFIHEISFNDVKLKRLANQNKFKEQKLSVAFALNNSVSDWMINTMKKIVWHRLNDIQILYKDVLGISFELEHPVIDAINKRHHLVHRNGYDLEGNLVSISDNDLENLITTIKKFIAKIDEKYTS